MSSRWILFGLVVLAGSSCGDARPTVIYSFVDGQVSSDGSRLTIEAYPERSCYEFLRADTVESGENLVVSLVYLGPEPDQFCELSCPIGREQLEVDLNPSVDPALNVVDDPEAEPTCTERLEN